MDVHQALGLCCPSTRLQPCTSAGDTRAARLPPDQSKNKPKPKPALCPGSQDYSKARSSAATAAAAATVVRAVDKSKETPQEWLKRLMAAQLNKKIQKDSLSAAQVRAGLAVRVEAWHAAAPALDKFCLPSRVLRPFALPLCP